jgi:diguanylate cyclase (GGDEF)-like protein
VKDHLFDRLSPALLTSHPTILVVGNTRLTNQACRILAELGYAGEVAEDFDVARFMLVRVRPYLLLISLGLGETESFDFARQLRADPRWTNLPIIFLGNGKQQNVRQALIEGDDYIKSPSDREDMAARIEARLHGGPLPGKLQPTDVATGLLSQRRFHDELERELYRFRRSGSPASLASISIHEIPSIREKYGESGVEHVMRQAADRIRGRHRMLDVLARSGEDEIAMLMPETTAENGLIPLDRMSGQIVVSSLDSQDGELRLTPVIGIADFWEEATAEELWRRARHAREFAESQLDLRAVRWDADIESWAAGRSQRSPLNYLGHLLQRLGRFELTFQVGLTFVLGLLLPFTVYVAADRMGVDVSRVVYLVVVASLVLTGSLIWIEGFLAFKRPVPPAEPREPYPPATAIIAAYLPNEAATVAETVRVFLALEYPADLQVILAYNSPVSLPVEQELASLADQHPNLRLLKVRDSNSKAQNVNAALREATGHFVGVFDADHHPQSDAFMRAWRWLSSGYSVVQGHCMIRNGDSSALARLVAVEFEAMYAVSHPGRARLHHFAIFGGSNGFWRTDVLHKIRMRSSMLTEDIDSSIRLLMSGDRIVCDPGLVSTELAPLSLRHLWNQRMRWAQGWFQVSLTYLWRALFSSRFSVWQRLGIAQLLFWREVYPWVALQIVPLVSFWTWKLGSIEKLDWLIPIFVLTTLFTLTVGPGQSLLAYLLGDPRIKRHRIWFVAYFFFASVFYAEFKNTISRVAQIRQLLGQKEWVVTPRQRQGEEVPRPLIQV